MKCTLVQIRKFRRMGEYKIQFYIDSFCIMPRYRNMTNRGHTSRSKVSNHAKAQFVQTNFRYIVDPEYKYKLTDPDERVPWHFVKVVLFTPDEDYCRPVCLDTPCAPKITPCGHIYCNPCLIHLFQGYNVTRDGVIVCGDKIQKCPMCNEVFALSDVRPVDIIRVPSRNEGEFAEFVLLKRGRNSTVPILATMENDSGSLPLYSEVHSPFSRFQILDPVSLERRYLGAEPELLKREKIQLRSGMEFIDQTEKLFYQLALEQTVIHLELWQNSLSGVAWGEDTFTSPPDYDPDLEEEFYNDPNVDLLLRDTAPISWEDLDDEPIEEEEEEEVNDIVSELESKPFKTDHHFGQVKLWNRNPYYYFYQDQSGHKLFIHPDSIRMLREKYHSYENFPNILRGKILKLTEIEITHQSRKQHRIISHLPLDSSCSFCTIECE